MIIDISCDKAGAIETSVPTSISESTYFVDGIRHYVVDHTPALFYKSTTEAISAVLPKYLNSLMIGNWCGNYNAHIAERGNILDETILNYQNR